MNGSVVLGRSPSQPNAVGIAKGELTPGQLTQPKSDFLMRWQCEISSTQSWVTALSPDIVFSFIMKVKVKWLLSATLNSCFFEKGFFNSLVFWSEY